VYFYSKLLATVLPVFYCKKNLVRSNSAGSDLHSASNTVVQKWYSYFSVYSIPAICLYFM